MSAWLSPTERRVLWQRRRWIAIGLLAIFLVLLFLDRTIFHVLNIAPDDASRKWLEEAGWYQMFRAAGYLPTWIIIGLALFLQALRPARAAGPRTVDASLHRATTWAGPLIVLAAALSGLVADVVKPVFGRLRPIQTDGLHRYYGLPDDLTQGAAYGLPSSHAAVAFGAAFMVLFIWPRAGMVAMVAAIGCGFTRTFTGAHFVTDVFVAAVLAYAIARLVRPSGWYGAASGAGGPRILLP